MDQRDTTQVVRMLTPDERKEMLESINSPADLRKLPVEELPVLARALRDFMVESVSKTGGHLSSSLGATELAIALHYVFNTPEDAIVWDVGHQAYAHKILTGRRDAMATLRQTDGISGFPKRSESPYDAFGTAHSSTSISAALGMAVADSLNGKKDRWHIAVIGDGSLSGGEALEGLDYAVELDGNLIIIVNDNDMSIAENHGGLYGNLKLLRETNGQAECNLFKAMGLDYMYVHEGNDIPALIKAFEGVKDSVKPVVVHIRTLKGKGYKLAETHKEEWHWHLPFDIETGEVIADFGGEDYSSVTCDYLMKKMKEDPSVVTITSATPTVMGFTEDKRKEAGRQFVDVGIAEETAVALASGIAKSGGKPVYGVYSTFIQRTYDQLAQDLCVNGNPATILTFSASIYGMNDVTHLGIYDIPMMANIPGLVYLAPTTKEEYLAMLDWSIAQTEHPVAIRVPGGAFVSDGKAVTKDFSKLNKYEITKQGSKVAIIGLGSFYGLGVDAAEALKESTGIEATIINPYYITGLDEAMLEDLKANHDVVITLEDGILDGGFGEKITRFYGASDMKVLNFGIKKEFLDRYDVNDVLKDNHLTVEQIVDDVKKCL